MGASVPTIILSSSDPLFDYFLFIGRSKFVGEMINLPLNILLLPLFYYLHQKEVKKMKASSTKAHRLQQSTIILTYLLLIFGILFSIAQVIFENLYLQNC
eukprot:169799_1